MADDSRGGLFTGERLLAGDPLFRADLSRHLIAYQFAQERIRGKRVLDAGCGDGYGTHLLAATAAHAVGVDRSAETIAMAAQRYQRARLSYRVCEIDRLTALGQRFEVVCNFQVIEHLVDPMPFLQQVKSVLEPGGCLILTTPNRLNSFVENPYHVHEYLAGELRDALRQVFPEVEILGVYGDEQALAYERLRVAKAQRILRLDPFKLRRLIPRPVIEFAYPHLARLVRRRVADADRSVVDLRPENFTIAPHRDASLDLLAIAGVS
jgi:SAM-dependent methyltransferase